MGVASDCERTCASLQVAHPLDGDVYACLAMTKTPL